MILGVVFVGKFEIFCGNVFIVSYDGGLFDFVDYFVDIVWSGIVVDGIYGIF